jgi:hypothetical protein
LLQTSLWAGQSAFWQCGVGRCSLVRQVGNDLVVEMEAEAHATGSKL